MEKVAKKKNEKEGEIAQIKYESFGKGSQERTTKSQGRLKKLEEGHASELKKIINYMWKNKGKFYLAYHNITIMTI